MRYASAEMVSLFEPATKVVLERELWLAVLDAQIDAGLEVDRSVIDDYLAVIDDVDFESIERRERVTRHDVKARLEEFNALAGHEHLHKGLTSRDATENVEQVQIARALDLVERRTVALLSRLAERAAEYAALTIVGRTHNVAAQPTTLGKRFASLGEELLAAHGHVVAVRDRLALRGLKGPVGSQQDLLDLLGSVEQVEQIERHLGDAMGVERVLGAVGQVYPRSLDLEVVSALVQLGSAPANLALAVRLMAGHDLATEGFAPGQVGSSAMPHKMNTRSAERINGLYTILRGHLTMAAGLAGDQWLEGDVSCSVVRRVVLPDAFFAIDGQYETTFAVLDGFGAYEGVIDAELARYLPFLATTGLLMHAVRAGMGREEAHAVIKEHAVAAALAMRDGTADGTQLVRALGDDDRFPGSTGEVAAVVDGARHGIGLVDAQIGGFCAQVEKLAAGRPESAYRGAGVI
ncbi:MAG: adenylosuccinate lyase [Actinomycetota bacterium]